MTDDAIELSVFMYFDGLRMTT